MIHLPASVRVYLCLTPCDMRKSFDGLQTLVREHLELDAFAGHLFVFTSRRKDRVKILYWDRDGFAVWRYKRLSKGRFVWWPEATGTTKPLEAYEAQLLLAAGDLSRVRAAPMWRRVGVLK